ncbi:MAG: alpha/beta fold hydrolase, partial [Desulfuromonadales bacterium]|nr:alpha/beta fold hydrolase [Desulfuromonadales bacterium]
RLRQALHIERWIVFGHSWGGILAQAYAIQHPQRVSKLILADTFSCAEDVNSALERMRAAVPEETRAVYERFEQEGLYKNRDRYPLPLKMQQGQGRGEFKEGDGDTGSRRAQFPGEGDHLRFGDLDAIHPDALGKRMQVGRGVKAGAMAGPGQHFSQGGADRTLAVAAGHMDGRVSLFRVSEAPQQSPDILQPELDAEALQAVQIVEALPVVHGTPPIFG